MSEENNPTNKQNMNKPEVPPQAPQAASAPKSPKSNKRMMQVIIGIIVLIAVGALAYYFLLSPSAQQVRLLRKSSITWKLYKNDNDLITFRYPAGWTVKEDFVRLDEGLWNINIFRKNDPQDITGIGLAGGFYGGENLEGYVEQESARLIEDGFSSVSDTKAISIDDKVGYTYDFHVFFEDSDLIIIGTNSYFADGVGYVVSYGVQSTSDADPDEMAAIYAQVIDSIKTPYNPIEEETEE